MERYSFFRHVLIIGTAVLGLLVLVLMALPGDLSARRLLTVLVVYIVAVIVGSAAFIRHPDR